MSLKQNLSCLRLRLEKFPRLLLIASISLLPHFKPNLVTMLAEQLLRPSSNPLPLRFLQIRDLGPGHVFQPCSHLPRLAVKSSTVTTYSSQGRAAYLFFDGGEDGRGRLRLRSLSVGGRQHRGDHGPLLLLRWLVWHWHR